MLRLHLRPELLSGRGFTGATARHRRPLFAALALAAFSWLCLGDTASAAAPANDDFANAAVLSGLPANATGRNVDATTEPGEPEHTDFSSSVPGKHSVWWSWTAPSDGDVTVDTCGSNFDTLLAVYTGNSVEALTRVARNDSAFGGCGGTDRSGDSELSFAAQSGEVYRIAVDGATGRLHSATGRIALALNGSPQPANDDFANAAVLTEDENEQSSAIGTNAGASKETGEPSHAGEAGGHSVWWTWTAPRSGVVGFQTCGSPDVDTLLAVYTGDAVGALTEVASAPADSSCHGSFLSFRASAGLTYHIAVDGAAGSIGGFRLHKTPTPPNDEFENAAPLSGLSATDYGYNSSATSEPGEPNHAGNAAGHSLWWRWTAPANGLVQIDTCNSYYPDTVLAVYTGDAVDALSPVASNDDLASCVPYSGVAFTADAGTTYRIAADGAAGPNAIGIIVLSLRETPASAGPPPPPPATPSNDFTLGNVKHNKRVGTAKLTVELPGPGAVVLAKTKKVKADQETADAAGTEKLLVKPKGKARQKLNHKGKAKVTAKVTYTPTDGEPNTESKKIKLVKR